MIARPEGLEIKGIGAVDEESEGEADASAKPMLLREACDLCEDVDGGPMCVSVCPFNAVYTE